MSLRDSQFGELKVPLTWTAAVALVVAAVVAVALLVTDRRQSLRAEAYGVTRGMADTVLAPVGDALSAPGRWTGEGVEAVRGYFFAVSENRELKSELKEMQQWRVVAIALKNENSRYRTLLGLQTDPPIQMVAARIVTDSRGPFADTRLANTGREKGVRVGNPVMSENGLVGQVIGVTHGASRVLLLTDAASRTPVMIDRTNARAILTGDGGPNPRLDYLRGQNPVKEGDLVLTSGDGGLMPRGLPVGVAVKGLDGKWRVVLASDRGPIDFVRILLFQDFAQLVDRKELDKVTPPPPTPGAETLTPPPAIPIGPAAAGAASTGAAAKPQATPAAGAAAKASPTATAGANAPEAKTPVAKAAEAKPAKLAGAGKPSEKSATPAETAKSGDKSKAAPVSPKTPAPKTAKAPAKPGAAADGKAAKPAAKTESGAAAKASAKLGAKPPKPVKPKPAAPPPASDSGAGEEPPL